MISSALIVSEAVNGGFTTAGPFDGKWEFLPYVVASNTEDNVSYFYEEPGEHNINKCLHVKPVSFYPSWGVTLGGTITNVAKWPGKVCDVITQGVVHWQCSDKTRANKLALVSCHAGYGGWLYVLFTTKTVSGKIQISATSISVHVHITQSNVTLGTQKVWSIVRDGRIWPAENEYELYNYSVPEIAELLPPAGRYLASGPDLSGSFDSFADAQSAIIRWMEFNFNLVDEHFRALNAAYMLGRVSGWSRRANFYFVNTADSAVPPLQNAFRLQEVEAVRDGLDFTGKSFYEYNWLVEHAFVDACRNMPKLSDNNISNLIDVVKFVKALVVDHRIEIPDSLSSAWLSYRYVYGTTRSDVEEAITFMKRYRDLEGLGSSVQTYGVAYYQLASGEFVTCRCTMRVTPKEVSLVQDIWRALYTYGLQPNFYVVWDMIPYSFIVDWFIPVGDMVSILDIEDMYLRDRYYDLSDICLSLSYDTQAGTLPVHCYTRWPSAIPEFLHGFYWLDSGVDTVSNRTLVCRIVDAASLFIGRR